LNRVIPAIRLSPRAESFNVNQRVLLLQIDGKIPNLALMRIASHHRLRGDDVELRHAPTVRKVERGLFDDFAKVYASAIFERSRPVVKRLLQVRPDAIVGGSGWDEDAKLGDVGVDEDSPLDYTDYPRYTHSIGFTQRGCRLACSFCKVRRMEGKVRELASCWDIWRGEGHPKNLLLLDNDFFGAPNWRTRIDEMRSGGFRVSFNQGFNIRLIGDEEAAAIAGVPYYDDQFKVRRLYTAWDNRKDEALLFRNLDVLKSHGVKPDQIQIYMLVGYDHATKTARPELTPDDFYRQARLREFGARPYPMPFIRTPDLVAFQRWVVRRIDLMVPWDNFKAINCRPERIGHDDSMPLFKDAS
jgi:hypothetical protein